MFQQVNPGSKAPREKWGISLLQKQQRGRGTEWNWQGRGVGGLARVREVAGDLGKFLHGSLSTMEKTLNFVLLLLFNVIRYWRVTSGE